MLTSKDIIGKTGISRATLNNYIASGLVPRPQVLAPGPDDGGAPRIGYFPDDTIERIETIQRLKREGWSIGRIASHFAGPQPAVLAAPASAGPVSAASVAPVAAPRPADAAAPPAAPAAAPGPAARGSRGAPALTPVAILHSALEDAPALWVKLSAHEYFELVNEVWGELDRIFREHGGLLGRHPDEGVVCYFLPRRDHHHVWDALSAACRVRAAMRQLSRRWQLRKGWDIELRMNSGIDEGQDWMGTIGGTGAGDLRVLGEVADRAEQLALCSRGGAVLVTRNLLGKLSADERRRLTFGVPRPDAGDAQARLLLSFARLQELAPPGQAVPPRVAGLAVAELLDLPEAGAGPAPGPKA